MGHHAARQLLRAIKTFTASARKPSTKSSRRPHLRRRRGHREQHRHRQRRSRGERRQVRQPGHPRSHPRARHRHPRRAARERSAHPLPHRRHPARSRRAAAVARAPKGDHFAAESHGAHGHRRAPAAAGWPHQFEDARPAHRRARLDDPDGQRREHLLRLLSRSETCSSASTGST